MEEARISKQCTDNRRLCTRPGGTFFGHKIADGARFFKELEPIRYPYKLDLGHSFRGK
jgi:hypothetical protein